MEAAARPLPSDETTPPVTRMYLTGRVWDCGIWLDLSGGYGLREQRAHARQVFGRVDADRFVSRFHCFDADPVFERAELLERFGALERRLRQRRQPEERVAPVDVEPDM